MRIPHIHAVCTPCIFFPVPNWDLKEGIAFQNWFRFSRTGFCSSWSSNSLRSCTLICVSKFHYAYTVSLLSEKNFVFMNMAMCLLSSVPWDYWLALLVIEWFFKNFCHLPCRYSLWTHGKNNIISSCVTLLFLKKNCPEFIITIPRNFKIIDLSVSCYMIPFIISIAWSVVILEKRLHFSRHKRFHVFLHCPLNNFPVNLSYGNRLVLCNNK